MSDRQKIISRLIADRDFRADYIRAKLDVLIPSQLRALRMRENKTQPELAQMADMKQSRISAMETPGLVNFNRETLVRMAATHSVGMVIKFVPFSEMLEWENEYSQDSFDVVQLANDINFLQPARATRRRARRKRVLSSVRIGQMPIAASRYVIPVPGERAQLKLQFETSQQPSAQARITEVITLPNRSSSFLNDLPFLKTAAAGAGANYVNR
jgi:hypothetical protein